MIGRAQEIFRDVYDLMNEYTDAKTFWENAKAKCSKYDKPNDTVFIIDMLKAGQSYIEVERQSEKR